MERHERGTISTEETVALFFVAISVLLNNKDSLAQLCSSNLYICIYYWVLVHLSGI